jgi:hypothetical protein
MFLWVCTVADLRYSGETSISFCENAEEGEFERCDAVERGESLRRVGELLLGSKGNGLFLRSFIDIVEVSGLGGLPNRLGAYI